MKIIEYPVSWYIEKIERNEPFSICTMGDGEFIAAFGKNVGGQNAEATQYTPELCQALQECFRFQSSNFYFAAPAILKNAALSGIGEERIDRFQQELGIDIEFHEMEVWDQAMKAGQFGGLIKALRKKNVCIISNQGLRLLTFLKYDKFIETGYPNCFEEIPKIVEEVKAYNRSGVYLVAMGLAAPILCQKLHAIIPNSWFLDTGSCWDTFVGIGAQRGFRTELYDDHIKYARWWHSVIDDLCK